jgi:dephospho-CoA kinase
VLLVDAPEALQLERTMARDQNSEAQVQAIIKAQASRAERQARADDIVVNDGSLADLLAKVEALHERYLALAAGEAAPA